MAIASEVEHLGWCCLLFHGSGPALLLNVRIIGKLLIIMRTTQHAIYSVYWQQLLRARLSVIILVYVDDREMNLGRW